MDGTSLVIAPLLYPPTSALKGHITALIQAFTHESGHASRKNMTNTKTSISTL